MSGIDDMKIWQDEQMHKHGWYAHYVFQQSSMPLGVDSHTHGLVETYGHPDLQIVYPAPSGVTQRIFWSIVERIAAGEKFQDGDVASRILGNGYLVKFVRVTQAEREVLRVILPDAQRNLDFWSLSGDFALQYADLGLLKDAKLGRG